MSCCWTSASGGARDRRCILLTSAVAGEGKTTLAAHLAARAANTGIPTLLIDGDLRRASLGRLLDMPVGPGLAEVLAGKVAFEEATVTVQAGGFHFLPAGIPGLEPARVLKPDRLQKFLATVRERYELVLIDSPSVLLATDAALIGRHVDGVVLVAKFDESRLPAIKQAVTRLAYVGVPVLGAVMCGVPPKRMAGSDLYAYQFDASRPE